MLGRLVLLFLLTPAIELGLLIQVDRLIGFGPTIALIVVTGVVGSYLARREGLTTWRRLNERLGEGDLPGKELADGIIILVAGTLLITPGVLTDFVGFLGLLPPTRALIRRRLMRWFRSKVEEGSMQVQFSAFGRAAPRPGSAVDPDGRPGPEGESSDQAWKGQARRTPQHDGKAGPATEPSDEKDAPQS